MLVQLLVGFSHGSSLPSLRLLSTSSPTSQDEIPSLPTLGYRYPRIIYQHPPQLATRACWFDGLFLSFVLFWFQFSSTFLRKQRGSRSFTFLFFFLTQTSGPAIRLSHYDFIIEDGGIQWFAYFPHRLLCYFCFFFAIPTCARFVYIFSSSCIPFLSHFFFVSCFVCIISV